MNSEKAKRTIVIGDVHGCVEELQDLLRATSAGPADNLISVGDLIGKGPASKAVMQWAMSCTNLRCVLGNHEARYLQHWKTGTVPERETSHFETYQQLGSEFAKYMEFVNRWPLYINERDFLVVHAGIDPREPSLERQSTDDLIHLRNLNGLGTPWYEAYHDDRLIVFGHWARREAVWRRNAIGLDTGCVYGGALSALILPERRLVSVPARREYRKKDSWPTPT